MPMRRLSLILLSCLVVAPAALAGANATGDGVLEVSNVDGTILVTGKGVLWGQMHLGRLIVNDPIVGDDTPLVSGWEKKVPGACATCTVYSGKDLHFRVTGGKYRMYFDGAGIDFSAVGVGTAALTGDVMVDDPGDYAIDGGKWTAVPWLKLPVSFGVTPTPAGP
jgi:hypothetical protein